MSRRRFLELGGVTAATLALGAAAPSASGARGEPRIGEYPFTLGVASGDPLPHSVVIWTRLAPRPLEPGGGIDPTRSYPVQWQVASDERFRRVVRRGTALARPEYAHTVHVDVTGLQPGREYHYRFKAGPELSSVGRTKTAPARGARVSAFAFALASCQNWAEGYYTAYRDMARQDLDLVVHLGDYLYENAIDANGGDRRVPVPAEFRDETVTLERYRLQYGLYKSDPDLQAAHARFPWIVTIDDHDVDNDWAGDLSQDFPRVGIEEFRIRRANGLRAYWEHMPIRIDRIPVGHDMPLYRRFAFGDLAEFSVLDTRQYRTDQPSTLAGAYDPAATMTGAEQERWLLDGLTASRARWNLLAQQTAIAQNDRTGGPGESYGLDNWDGYRVQRQRLMDFFGTGRVRNPVVITGDQHRNLASDLKRDFYDPASDSVGVEFLGTSISSSGDATPSEIEDVSGKLLIAENPHIQYASAQRGYVRCTLTPALCRAEFRVAPVVTLPGAPVSTHATLIVEDGVSHVQRA